METKPAASADLQLAFDVGHSSIGWAVLQSGGDVAIKGCGAVVFRADDCLVSSRRAYRRQRRHIRSTRHRIAHLKVLLKHLGVLSDSQLNQTVSSSPWQLAARVLAGGTLLTWPELWDVLRWYAHNRGYDGNRRWSAADAEAQKEDSEKEANARTLMQKHGVQSMAETFCKELGVEPSGEKKSSMKRFKGLNAAFPRETVEGEVSRILNTHAGKLKGVDATLEKVLFSDWQAIPCPDLKLPKRYRGGLLFGQLVPRFDNRIISICPISGQKVPSRNCPEFLRFRWAMQLANIKVGKPGDRDLRPLDTTERTAIHSKMCGRGYLTPKELKDAVREATGCERNNLETMLLHPDAKEALLFDPVQKLVTSDDLRSVWTRLPERIQKRLRGQWRRGKTFSLAQIRAQLDSPSDLTAFDASVDERLLEINTKAKQKEKLQSREQLLQSVFPAKRLRLDGRAAYSRPLLANAADEVFAGKHPKEEGGCLFLTEEIRQRQLDRDIAQQTNNHLVRHRLLILERLLADIIKDYAGGDKRRIGKITVEVNRDLREMSGKTAKEKAQNLGQRIANHHAVVAKLEKAFEGQTFNGKPIHLSYGLIKKGRIAEDLGWLCPYTGQRFEPIDLVTKRVDKDHIVPRSDRPSDSLESLAITFSAINKWKGNRTAWKFIEQEQGKPVPDLPNLSVVSLKRFREFVDGLESYKGHDDDKRRKKRRKELFLLPAYEEKSFLPRDLTQTSQLVRLAAQVLKRAFNECAEKPIIVSLPGSVTGAVRKAWNVLGCLSAANPQVLDEDGNVRNKTEIRDITHLHHALDACVLALASHFIPNNGRVWELIIKRNLRDDERSELAPLSVFAFGPDNRFGLHDLDDGLKSQIRQRLSERRVVQHVPARMDGLRVEQNTWRVVWTKAGEVALRQRIRQADGTRPEKITEEKSGKLLGLSPVRAQGKLAKGKGVLVLPENFGIALDPAPEIIPFHKVWPRLQEIKAQNGGKIPRVIRNGQIIRVPNGKNFKGVWKVFSAKNNASGMALDIGAPDVVRLRNKTEGHKINVRLATLIKDGLEVIKTALTGIAVCPTISSASTPPIVP